jgi:putative glycosyltransferase
VMDSDLDEDPAWITRFHGELTARPCDVVYGISRPDRGVTYRIGHRLFHRLIAALSGARHPRGVCTARLMTRRYVDALMRFPESEVYLAGLWHLAGFAQVPVEVDKRHASPTTYTLPRLAGLFVDAVTTYSTRPLSLMAGAAIAVFAVALLYAASVIAGTLWRGSAVPGWPSLMVVTLLCGGLSVLVNGVIAIYVAKIFVEVKRRPRTIVREVTGRPGTR